MTDTHQTDHGLVPVETYQRRALADERALVVSAMGHAWKLEEDENGGFVLLVYERNREAVERELQKFEAEDAAREKTSPVAPPPAKIPLVSLFVFGWIMAGFFAAQNTSTQRWEYAGTASSNAIWHHGEWWLAVTALTLHADFSHLAANLASGLLFAAFILPLLGTGWTWTLILASGTAGNLINAWVYRDSPHFSIGASTAVFGALGILTACQALDAMRSARPVRLREVLVPLGAGIALLAYLGVGDDHTDLLAHLWGFVAGVGMGVAAILFRLKQTSTPWQRLLCVLPLIVLAVSWALALRH